MLDFEERGPSSWGLMSLTLAAYLEVKPRLALVFFRGFVSVGELVALVVLVNQIFDDGTRFPNGQSRIGVFNGRDTTVGVDLFVRLLLQVGELHQLNSIGDAELLQEDVDL